MKRFLYIIIFLFFSFTFHSMPLPGWYQQTLPVNDFINDIFFLDSLNGWIVTDGDFDPPDTGYILHTTNGGDNWNIQLSQTQTLNVIQFLDLNTGYAAGGSGHGIDRIFKTSNGGENWIQIGVFGITLIDDMYFLNRDTGWICDHHLWGGLYKTTNGGNSWVQQLDENYSPLKLFFINKDTGWVGTDVNRLYRTTNGGTNWSLQYVSNIPVLSLFFINANCGWMRGGTGNGVLYTTDGGFTWTNAQGNVAAGFDLFFVNDSIGFSGMQSWKISRSTDGGRTWGYQVSPNYNNMSVSAFKNNPQLAWAGGTGVVHTTDGGGPIIYTGIKHISNTIPKDFILYQNYPNPFNPNTIIKFNIKKTSDVSLKVYDIGGRLIDGVFYKNVHSGEYEYKFDGTGLPSGVYFYSLSADGNVVDTRKMVLIK